MRIKKLVELYMNPIDIIEIYDKNRKFIVYSRYLPG